jgi:cell wall-associated NlpC family hydrolase
VQLVFELLGIDLPRNSSEQARCGVPVRRLEDLEPFDLLFFGETAKISHVAIHLGGLDMLHASGCVAIESLDPASARFREDLRGIFRGARRVAR